MSDARQSTSLIIIITDHGTGTEATLWRIGFSDSLADQTTEKNPNATPPPTYSYHIDCIKFLSVDNLVLLMVSFEQLPIF